MALAHSDQHDLIDDYDLLLLSELGALLICWEKHIRSMGMLVLVLIVLELLVGGFFAALVFAIFVVSIPMILDRDTDAISAAITSLQVVFSNIWVMLLWGLLVTALVAVALVHYGAGLLLIGPWLGHASWHAYKGAVHWL